MSRERLTATVSGSFRRSMRAVQDAVYTLTDAGVTVLSPADPRVVAQTDDFVFVASDRVRSIKLVQSRHLEAIAASDFLWVENQEGYLGLSGAMEIGYAIANRVPVFAAEPPTDLTLQEYVTVVRDTSAAVWLARQLRVRNGRPSFLIDPDIAAAAAHTDIELIRSALTSPIGDGAPITEAGLRLESALAGLR
jgi:hypothetical protein